MRTWLSFPTGIRGIRLGAAVNLNTTASSYYVSAAGAKIWRVGSTLMWAGLAIWLIASRDEQGRISEWWWIVVSMVLGLRYLFAQVVLALYMRR
jgi:hypothetical protein